MKQIVIINNKIYPLPFFLKFVFLLYYSVLFLRLLRCCPFFQNPVCRILLLRLRQVALRHRPFRRSAIPAELFYVIGTLFLWYKKSQKPWKFKVPDLPVNRGWENRTPTKGFGDPYHTIWPIPCIKYIIRYTLKTAHIISQIPSKVNKVKRSAD